ncbi:MAG: DUF1287 domain-containing protein [Cystobacterineae bacterium]|nr:DUF1287 domain-containing protein [Cystobacterineae bacterium]
MPQDRKHFRIGLILGLGLLLAAGKPVGWGIDVQRLLEDARSQIGVTKGYDAAWRKLSYPGGDVPLETGVCTDVVIRALRRQKVDLQRLVHEDMVAYFSRYPQRWGAKRADSSIDHRRVPNVQTFLKRRGFAIATGKCAEDFLPGDIVTWDLGRGVGHIGIVSDKKAPGGTPLVIHNIGFGVQEEDMLFLFKRTGHYRLY